MKAIYGRVPDEDYEIIMGLVGGKFFKSQSAVIRHAIKLLIASIKMEELT